MHGESRLKSHQISRIEIPQGFPSGLVENGRVGRLRWRGWRDLGRIIGRQAFEMYQGFERVRITGFGRGVKYRLAYRIEGDLVRPRHVEMHPERQPKIEGA